MGSFLQADFWWLPQDLWLLKDSRKSVKANKAAFGQLHLTTTGTKVARTQQVWSQVLAAVMEIE